MLRKGGILFKKDAKQIFRNPSLKNFIIWSLVIPFGALYLMWLASNGKQLSFLKGSSGYTPLSFDLRCFSNISPLQNEWNFHCTPKSSSDDESSVSSLSPADILFNIVSSSNALSEKDTNSKKSDEFGKLISAMLMNGLPLLGLGDFVRLSDFVNGHIGSRSKNHLLEYTEFAEKFSNFLNIRNLEVRLSGNPCFVDEFADHLSTQQPLEMLKFKKFKNLELASENCCDNIFALVDFSFPDTLNDTFSDFDIENGLGDNCWTKLPSMAKPDVTVRIHPSSIPDTRDIKWAPRKGDISKYSSGQLLYFLSGFLSLQLELQNFFAEIGWGGEVFESNVFDTSNFESPVDILSGLLEELVHISNSENVTSEMTKIFLNSTHNHPSVRREVNVPVYYRAAPTHKFQQDFFWHSFGSMITIGLILFFSIPSSICAGYLKEESVKGQLFILSTCPEVYFADNVIGWMMVSSLWSFVNFLVIFAFLSGVLLHSSSFIPALALFLIGLSLSKLSAFISFTPFYYFVFSALNANESDLSIYFCNLDPIAALLSVFISNPDAVVIVSTSCVFCLMIPGLLYFDIAFDVQRSFLSEVLLCLFPPSACALVLRQLFSYESMGIAVGWTFQAPVSETPTFVLLVMLLFDLMLYSAFLIVVIASYYRQSKSHFNSSAVVLRRQSESLWDLLMKSVYTICRFRHNYESIDDIEEANMLHESHNENDCLFVRNLSKKYDITSKRPIEVLCNVNTVLRKGIIYSLLGGNGAGKTTFMKILGGFDLEYSGVVATFLEDDGRRRFGWCPQNDPLFDFLTVSEHLILMQELCSNENSTIDRNEIMDILVSLDMKSHENKLACELSGGMKRRLCMAMSLIGNPHVLLFDEPSSGCDSWTRELIRKCIIQRGSASIVVVSTHHLEDVEIMGDHILFLNDKHLEFDEKIGALLKLDGEDYFEFMTSNAAVIGIAVDWIAKADISFQDHSSSHGLLWKIALQDRRRFMQLIVTLESLELSEFSLRDKNINEILCSMYPSEYEQKKDNFAYMFDSVGCSQCSWIFPIPFLSLCLIRFKEFKATFSQLFWTQLILPFVVVYFISLGCRDVMYPKIEITSSAIGGVGEVQVAVGKPSSSLLSSQGFYSGDHVLKEYLDNSYSWSGISSSNQLFRHLLTDYYNHSQSRWASFVVDDKVEKWIETSVSLDSQTSNTNLSTLFANIVDVRNELCNSSVSLDEFDEEIGKNIFYHTRVARVCEKHPFFEVSFSEMIEGHNLTFRNQTYNVSNYMDTFAGNQSILMISMFYSLRSNMTMILNVTNDHAPPVFLKEVAPIVYESMDGANGSLSLPSYRLYIDPFPETNYLSQVYSQRGYVGSIMIVLFMMICTPRIVKNVVHLKAMGIKSLLHMSGMNYLTYWMSNACCDIIISCSTFLFIGLGIWSGGAPIDFYFFDTPPYPGLVFIVMMVLFSIAIVIASYAFVLSSCNQFSSQLFMLFSSIGNGVFIKLYLDRHPELHWLSSLFMNISPCYALSSSFFEIFKWHAIKMAIRNERILRSQEHILATYLTHCVGSLVFQIVCYFGIILVLEYYHLSFLRFLQRVQRFLFLYWDSLARLCSISRLPIFKTHPIYSEKTSKECEINISSYQCEKEIELGVKENRLTNSSATKVQTRSSGFILRYISNRLDVGIFPCLRKLPTSSSLSSTSSLTGDAEDTLSLGSQNSWLSMTSNDKNSFENGQNEQWCSNANVAIAVRDVSVEYASNHQVSLRHVNLCIEKGERVALMGMSGGGKSSLFKTLSLGENVPFSGNVTLWGYDLVKESDKVFPRNVLGLVPQDNGLLDYLTVEETIQIFFQIKRYYVENDSQRNDSIDHKIQQNQATFEMDFQGIVDPLVGILSDRYFPYATSSLSGGNKKRLLLAIAQLCHPRILLCDECTTGVDPIAASKMITYLSKCLDDNATQGVLFASHRVEECMKLCKRVIVLDQGRVMFQGSLQTFEDLAFTFFQVDLCLHPCQVHSFKEMSDVQKQIIEKINNLNDQGIERIVIYSYTLIRLTVNKKFISLSTLASVMEDLFRESAIKRYYFREMSLEEILSNVYDSLKEQNQQEEF